MLSTRIYRGEPPPGADSGIEFVSFGGVALLLRAEAHEMGSAWAPSRERALVSRTASAAAALASGASSALVSPRHLLLPTGGSAGAPGGGISEEAFRAAVAAALAEGSPAAGARAGGSLSASAVASPRAAGRLEEGVPPEVLLSISPHAAAY